MFLNRKRQTSVQKRPQKGSIIQDFIRQTLDKPNFKLSMVQEFDQPPMTFFSHQKNNQLNPNIQGVNTAQQRIFFSQTGTGTSLFTVNRSIQPGVNKSLLTVQHLDFNLIDYANTDFPQIIFLQLENASGYKTPGGVDTHAIGFMKICGSPTIIQRAGGIISYNIKYTSTTGNPLIVDITGMPQLIFNISMGKDRVRPASYPITDSVSGDLQITDVTF